MRRLLTVLAAGALSGALYGSGALGGIENRLADLRFRLLQRPASSDLVVVAIDPGSLRRLHAWPWPRGYHATVLENLLQAGAEQVAFDLDFSSRSVKGEDAELARALAAAGRRAVLPVFVQWDPHLTTGVPLVATHPLPPLATAATLASINIRPDRDGLIRRYLAGHVIGGDWTPSLAAALSGHDDHRSFLVDFGIDPATIPRLSYVDVLSGDFHPEDVAGRKVIIGATSVELGDQVAVPLHAALPGVLLQGLAFESLWQGRALARPPAMVTLALTLLAGLTVGPWILGLGWRGGMVATGGLCAAAAAGSLLLQARAGLVADVSPLVLMLVGCYGAGLLQRLDQQTVRLLLQGLSLRHKEVLIRQMLQTSFDAIFTVDADGRIESANEQAEDLFGRDGAPLVGRPVTELVGPLERTGGGLSQGRRMDGSRVPLDLVVSEVRAGGRPLRLVMARDMTQQQAQQAALEHQATHDALTDLPNRFLLQERMDRTLAASRTSGVPLAFMVLDLNLFKEVNDTLGHHVGDLLLTQIAGRLAEVLRAGDTIARIGGDEFAVLLPGADASQALGTARRLQAALDQPFQLEKLSLDIGMSIGISLFPDHGADAVSLLQRADVAMYVAKRERTGVAVYDARKDSHSIRNLTLMGDLKAAIEENQLSLSYQPKISCATGQVVGMEALLRWNHPRQGALSPDEFIRLAEATSLIRPLTQWVLEAALRQCAAWRREGFDVPLAVNLSVHNLKEGDLPGLLRRMLAREGLPATCLALEITESVIMDNPQLALDVATRLHRMGVSISIDDFGTGYSSLGYLKRLPARELKIDKAFVMEMDRDRDDAVIVRSIIELAHSLGLEVVAEGVEREAVWRELRRLGCDSAQGHFFSPPQPAAAIRAWASAHQAGGVVAIPLLDAVPPPS